MPSVLGLVHGRRAGWLALAVYLAVALICYAQVLNAFFLSDDFILLSAVKHGGPFIPWPIGSAQFVRPLPMLWLWTGFNLFGLKPLGFHLFNVLLLVLDAVLIRAIVLDWMTWGPQSGEASERPRFPGTEITASFAGLLFVVWPTHPEAVSWICACIDGLSTIFSLLALWALLRGFGTGKLQWIALSIAALILALLSKESALATVLILWLVALIKRGGQRNGGFYLALIGIPLAGFGYMLLRHYLIGAWIGGYGAAHLRVNHPDLVNKIYLNAGNAFVPVGPTLGAVLGASAIKSLTFLLFLLSGILIAARLPRREKDWSLAVTGIAIVELLWSANIALNIFFGDIFPIGALLAMEALILALVWLQRNAFRRVFGGWFGVVLITLCALYLFDFVLLPPWQATFVDVALLAAIFWSWWAITPPRIIEQSQRLWISLTMCSIAFGFLALAPGANLSINILGESSRFAFCASAFGALALAGIWKLSGLSSSRLGQIAAAPLSIIFAVLLFHSNEDWGEAGNISGEFAEKLRFLQPVRRIYAIVIPDSIGNAFIFRGGFDKVPELLGFPQTKERYCFRALYLQHGDRVETQRLEAQTFEIRIAATAARRAAWPGFIPTDLGDVGEWYYFSTHDASADVKLIGWQPGDRVVAFDGADWKVLL